MEEECRSLWIRAIDFSPKLASYCPHWREFTPMEWATLIAGNKDFINIAPRHSFGNAEWFIILHRQPTLIDKCEILNDMPEKYWTFLKKLYPWFEKISSYTYCVFPQYFIKLKWKRFFPLPQASITLIFCNGVVGGVLPGIFRSGVCSSGRMCKRY